MLTLPDVITSSELSKSSQGFVYPPGIKIIYVICFSCNSPLIHYFVSYYLPYHEPRDRLLLWLSLFRWWHLCSPSHPKKKPGGHFILPIPLYTASITHQILRLYLLDISESALSSPHCFHGLASPHLKWFLTGLRTS